MTGIVYYAVVFIIGLIFISLVSKLFSRHSRAWQDCSQRFRLTFKEGREEKGGQTVRAFRLKGYYRTCLITVYSSSGFSQQETIITISYPKNLLNSLAVYPEGLLGRISRGLAQQAGAKSRSDQPFFVSLPAGSGGTATDMQKELNPLLRERLIQLMIICGGNQQKLEITDAFLMSKQPGFTHNPAQLFPFIDEMISLINVLEANVDQLLI